MDELGARLLVGAGHQFPEGPVDGDEQPVPLVEKKAPHQRAVGPTGQTLLDQTDEPLETVRAGFADAFEDERL